MIEVREGRLGKSVHATKALEPGQPAMSGWGTVTPIRTRHSIQVDRDAHVTINTPIQFLNHSCEPNCGLLIRRDLQVLEVHPIRLIEPGEELTIDYATFEDEIQHMHGACLCGTPSCRGRITGYPGLPAHRREVLRPYIAEHLLELDAPVSRAG
jgi:hypothetical protein